ncbi:radical SAM protein [Candidatus Omnitrophota bacterium]
MHILSFDHLIAKSRERLIPLNCLFELTHHCNLKCVHCFIKGNNPREIDKEAVFSLLKQLKKSGCLYLTFSGGEVLLRSDFFEIAGFAKKLNFALRIFTNGTLINDQNVDRIRELYPLAVEISLYGFRDTHERITRVRGSFQRTTDAIRLLAAKRVRVLVKAVLMRQNIDQIWKLNKFVKGLGAQVRHPAAGLSIFPCDDGSRRPLKYRPTARQLKHYFQREFKEFRGSEKEVKPMKVKASNLLCGTGWNSCNITPYGALNPCAQIRLDDDNDLVDKSLIKVWRSNKEINRLRSLRVSDRIECRGCALASYCFACPGMSLLERGSLLARLPESCRQARIRKEVYEGLNK